MSLEELLFRNEIVREALGVGEIGRLLATVDRRLEDASHALLHPETRLEQAYHAILGCAVIGLRAHGLRAVDRPRSSRRGPRIARRHPRCHARSH